MAYEPRACPLPIFVVMLALFISTVACGLPMAATPTATLVFPTQNLPSATLTATTQPQPTQTFTSTAAAAAPLPTSTPPPAPTATRQPPQVSEVTIFFIAVGDNGQSGPKIGCGDSLVAVKQPIEPTSGVIRAALNRLFSFKTQYIGESGLYNALWQSDLALDSARVDNGVATVYLTGTLTLGGVCDNPRVKAQIVETILAQPGVTGANVYINNVPIDEALSLK